MPITRDQLNRHVTVPEDPRRIVCLCPSLTETLFALDLGDRIAGRTRFCIHPADQVARVPAVGGTKDASPDAVADLRPDLVVAEKEENTPELVQALTDRGLPVFVFDVTTFEGGVQSILTLGDLADRRPQAAVLAAEIRKAFAELPRSDGRSVLYLIWRRPYMAAGRNTYIHSLLKRCGYRNAAADLPGRYPELTPEQLLRLDPDLVFLSSEPFPFEPRHMDEINALGIRGRTMLVDGEVFSWYGARMLHAADDLKEMLRS